jgi:hypothetical protein
MRGVAFVHEQEPGRRSAAHLLTPATRPDASPPTSPSCRCCCGPNRALPYSITLSARATNVGGTVTLSELNQVFGKAA